MAEITAVSRERHAGKTWQRPANFFFASKDAIAALTSQEIPRALSSMAIGFVASDGGYLPAALQGIKPGQNRFVSSSGSWLGEYIPAIYRVFPFRLARNENNVEVLCVDEEAAQVSDNDRGEPFFMPDGSPAPAVAEAFKLLLQLEKDRQNTEKACAVLARLELFEPWPLRGQQGEETFEASGVFRIAETRIYSLDATALTELRDCGGLMLAFGQLFSMQQIHKIGKLGLPPAGSAAVQPAPKLLEENGIISFANL